MDQLNLIFNEEIFFRLKETNFEFETKLYSPQDDKSGDSNFIKLDNSNSTSEHIKSDQNIFIEIK